MTPSSMKIEFSQKEDLKQACYEATLDLTLFITHIENIAERAQKNFPEVAAGLHGTADGIKQYLQGVDGEWRSPANVLSAAALNVSDFETHLWSYEFCRDPRAALLLFGCCVAIAAAKPQMRFWEVLALARGKMSMMEPLVEQLLASSPERKRNE